MTDRQRLKVGPFLLLPGLRGFWPMSAFESGGNAFDQSGNGRILTYNGNPTYNYDKLVPYINLDGTGDYLSRADEAGLDILGSESYVASAARGLTIGGWFWIDVLPGANGAGYIAKWNDAGVNQRSYLIWHSTAANVIGFYISSLGTGATIFSIDSSIVPAISQWYFIVGRFDPSTELAIWINGVKDTNAVAIPAAIFNSTASLTIGRWEGGGAGVQYLDGRASLNFLCAAALSDDIIGELFSLSRGWFGV